MKNSKNYTAIKFILVIIMLCGNMYAHAQIKLPALIADGMVLQRDQPLKLWGWAAPNEKVTVTFLNKSYQTKANNDKKWMLTIPAQHAGGPFDMSIAGSNSITIKNILIGDVWICSGQSNMQLQMGELADRYAIEIANSTNDMIRQFGEWKTFSFNEFTDTRGAWKEADPKNVLSFTAVGYFFALEIYAKYKVPIGLINASRGNTPAEAWVSESGLKNFSKFVEIANRFKDSLQVKAVQQKDRQTVDNWHANVNKMDKGVADTANLWTGVNYDASNWLNMTIPGLWDGHGIKGQYGAVYFRKEIDVAAADAGKDAVLNLGTIDDEDTTYFNGKKVGFSTIKTQTRAYKIPGALITAGKNIIVVRVINTDGNGGFAPGAPGQYELVSGDTKIPLGGEWQYQVGATVAQFDPASLTTFFQQPTVYYNSMIAPLIPYIFKGVIWYQGENNTKRAAEYQTLFPDLILDWRKHWHRDFPFIFTQLAGYAAISNEPGYSDWAELREAQSKTQALPSTGMAVIHDIGERTTIHPHNKKDVGLRLALVAEKVAYGDKNVIYTAPVYKSIEISGNKIIISFSHIESGLVVKDNGDLKYFAIAGSDRKFVWANAKIEGDKVIVWSEAISAPVAVRYAWANNPESANLYNTTGLPVSSFRTDNWVKP